VLQESLDQNVQAADEDAVRKVLRWDALIEAMEGALASFSSGGVQQPVRTVLTVEPTLQQ
jgi:hypothetical protein